MTTIIGCVSHKGGAGSSTMARLLATEYSRDGVDTILADMDNKQLTSTHWAGIRDEEMVEPAVQCLPVRTPKAALKNAPEMVIFDGKPAATVETLEIAKLADLVILPSSVSYDDLRPQIILSRELVGEKISRNRIAVVLLGHATEAEIRAAREFIEGDGLRVIPTFLPAKASYRTMAEQGRAVSETSYPALNKIAMSVKSEIDQILKGKKNGS